MGFRFRKSIGKGPFKLNISKSGVGYSVGGKGFRYTKKAGGGTRTTASIPGTGISYVKDSSSTKAMPARRSVSIKEDKVPMNNDMVYCKHCYKMIPADSERCPFCKKTQKGSSSGKQHQKLTWMHKLSFGIIIFTLILMLPQCSESKEPTSAETTPTTLPITTTDATEEPETASAPFDVNDVAQGNSAQESEKTYILNSGTMKFHKPTCSSADEISDSNRSSYTGTRTDLIDKGYEPCGRCNP